MPRKPRTLQEAAEVVLSRSTAELGGCLRYQRPTTNGYGMVRADGRQQLAHRVAWLAQRGPIPEGFDLDHLCHSRSRDCAGGRACLHRSCVNVDHLEPVPHGENVRRGVVASRVRCSNGHALTEANTYWKPSGHRQCRRCNNESCREWRRREALRAASVPSERAA